MANIITIKRSSVAGKLPNVSDLQVGELALNLADGIIYSKNTTGNVIVVGSSTTSNITEGANLYFTNTRAIGAFTSGTGVTIAANGLITVAVAPTYTDANTYANVSLLGYATTDYVSNAVANVVASAPAALDTLNELATALGNDNNFSTSILTIIGNKANTSVVTSAFNQANVAFAQANVAFNSANVRFLTKANVSDLTTANVTEVTNQYFTNARALAAVANTGLILANLTTTGNITVGSGVGGNITGVDNLYATNVYSNTIIANAWVGIYTANVLETSGNLYFTNTRTVSAFTQGYGISIAANGLLTVTAVSTAYSDANTYANVSVIGFATNAQISALTTSGVAEGANLYFTNTRAIGAFTAGTGIQLASNGLITSTASGTSFTGSSFTKQITINMESDIPDRLIDYGSISFTTTEQYDFGSIA